MPLRIHHGLYVDETSHQCHWHLPEAHYLEAWSDARAYDGTASIVQPLIEPLYEGRSAHEVVALLAGLQETPGREIVREHWRRQWEHRHEEGDFEPFWQKALHDGVIPDTALQAEDGEARRTTGRNSWRRSSATKPHPTPSPVRQAPPKSEDDLEIVFLPDPTIYDGSWANNGWLQELPKPLTKLTWGNAAIISPATAKQLGVELGSYAHGGEHGGYSMPVVELQLDGRSVRAPAWIMPGHADGTVTVYLGHGRRAVPGEIGGSGEQTVGFNAYLLRTADRPWFASGLHVVKTGDTELVACTQAASVDGEPRAGSRRRRWPSTARIPSSPPRRIAHEHGEVTTPRQPITLYEPFDYAAAEAQLGHGRST